MTAIGRRRLIAAGGGGVAGLVLGAALPAIRAAETTAYQRSDEMTDLANPMLETLRADAPDEALARKLRLYGQFVGSWDLAVEWHPPTGNVQRAAGEWHFAWVLEGRAVQDVWIFPSRHARAVQPQPWAFYGSTFRWYEPAIDAWHIRYFEPTRPFEMRQLGRAVGADIVQVGEDHNLIRRRWRFVEIAERSFRWQGHASWDRGESWTLELEMQARRV
jgi:hypothetical protein